MLDKENLNPVLIRPGSVEQQQNLVVADIITVEVGVSIRFHIVFNICSALGLNILNRQ